MAHQSGTDRHPVFFFSLDVKLGADHPVRAIDAFVDSLDLSALGFQKTQAKRTGSPPFHPGDLLKLYIYGYLNKVRSSRGLALKSAFGAVLRLGAGDEQSVSSVSTGHPGTGPLLTSIKEKRWRCFCTTCPALRDSAVVYDKQIIKYE